MFCYVGQSHPHSIGDVSGLQAALDAAGGANPHEIGDIIGLQAALDGKQATGTYLTGIDGPLVTGALGYTPVDPSRTISTTAPLAGGGDLSANRTFSISAATTGAAGSMSAADKTKLDGIATAATANATDAQLRDRATHTGTQASSTITGLGTAAARNISVGTSAPGSPAVNDLWVDTN